jgi:hypothetical protein
MRRQEYSFWGNCMNIFLLNLFSDSECLLIKGCTLPKYLIFSVCIVLCSSVTAIVLGVIFSITNTFRPFPDDIFRYGKDMILLLRLPLINLFSCKESGTFFLGFFNCGNWELL